MSTALIDFPNPQIDTVEVALAAWLIDPHPDCREAAYSFGYLHGAMAGHQFAVTGIVCDELTTELHHAYSHHTAQYLPALAYAVALAAKSNYRDCSWWDHDGHYKPDALRVIGFLRGWADTTEDCDGALTCADDKCGRRLFDDDDISDCAIDKVTFCSWHKQDWCRGATHQRECFE